MALGLVLGLLSERSNGRRLGRCIDVSGVLAAPTTRVISGDEQTA